MLLEKLVQWLCEWNVSLNKISKKYTQHFGWEIQTEEISFGNLGRLGVLC